MPNALVQSALGNDKYIHFRREVSNVHSSDLTVLSHVLLFWHLGVDGEIILEFILGK